MDEQLENKYRNSLIDLSGDIRNFWRGKVEEAGVSGDLMKGSIEILDYLVGRGPANFTEISNYVWGKTNTLPNEMKRALDFLSDESESKLSIENECMVVREGLIRKFEGLPESFTGFDRALYEVPNFDDMPFDERCFDSAVKVISALDKSSLSIPEIKYNLWAKCPVVVIGKRDIQEGNLIERSVHMLYRKNVINLDNERFGDIDYFKLNEDFFNQKP